MTIRTSSASAETTARALMALVNDLAAMADANERVRLQIEALATRHGVSLPRPPLVPQS